MVFFCKLEPDFSALPINILGQVILCFRGWQEGCPVNYKMLSFIPGLPSQDADSKPYSHNMITKNISRHCQMSRGVGAELKMPHLRTTELQWLENYFCEKVSSFICISVFFSHPKCKKYPRSALSYRYHPSCVVAREVVRNHWPRTWRPGLHNTDLMNRRSSNQLIQIAMVISFSQNLSTVRDQPIVQAVLIRLSGMGFFSLWIHLFQNIQTCSKKPNCFGYVANSFHVFQMFSKVSYPCRPCCFIFLKKVGGGEEGQKWVSTALNENTDVDLYQRSHPLDFSESS